MNLERGACSYTALNCFFDTYETVLILDTETSGLRCDCDEIIELSAAALRAGANGPAAVGEYDRLIRMSPGKRLDHRITELTGISESDLAERGIDKEQACADFRGLFSGRTLIAAYNAHFDLCFLYYLLSAHGGTECLRGADFLDILSIYRDRRDYPHRLSCAIEAYGLQDAVTNSHRAVDDVYAAAAVLQAMGEERQDLGSYVNLFGFNPRFGVDGKKIRSVRYVAQPYDRAMPLYERAKL